MLSVKNLSLTRGYKTLLQNISFQIAAGEYVGLIGPNGAGKSSLLKAVLGLQAAKGHSSLAALPLKTRAKAAAWLSQERQIAWELTVQETIALGRLPHGKDEGHAVLRSMSRLELLPLAQRRVSSLSGGEQARVLLARAIAQEAPLILADEPIANLDPAAQLLALEILQDEAKSGHAVFVALHDLSLAARFCTRLILIKDGIIQADGPVDEVLTEQNLADYFNINTKIWFNKSESPMIHILSRR